ncbi:hypothetical protein AYI69_g5525 [Smittium culicis]|uniref:Reverse transcriptase domain-containing protein n=1 Tax=Smittium culicis TaxID=133412 RepID=A0A1R1Y5Q9_9FUNG|nr:hypothetical protein AYI69_g5525 [Smittium culicis]
MDQEGINQVTISQDQLKEMTEIVRELLREKERNAEPEDSFATTRIPLTDLAVYSELIEAILSIEEDFFHTPLTEEERKEEIHSFPKMKKIDTTLHGIQVALAQATRSIDYCIHRRIQDNPGLTIDDQNIVFANTMRVLIFEIASMEKLEALISSKKTEKNSRIRKPFSGRQQISAQNGTYSKAAQAQTAEAVQTPVAIKNYSRQSNLCGRGGSGSHSKNQNRTARSNRRAGPLGWPIFVQKWPSTTKRPERFDEESAAFPKSNSEGAAELKQLTMRSRVVRRKNFMTSLDLEDAFMHILIQKTCKKYPRFWWNGKSYQFRVLSFGLSLSTLTSSMFYYQYSLELDHRGGMKHEHQQNLIQAARAGAPRAKEHCIIYTEILDGHSYSNRNCSPESEILEGATNQMEWTVIHPRKTRAGDLYRLQRQCMGGGIDAHQCQGATDDLICSTFQEGNRGVSTYILRQHNNPCICSEIWRHYIGEASGNRGTDLDAFSTNQHSPPSNLQLVSFEPGRCPEPTNNAKRMVNIRPKIHESERYFQSSRRGHIRFQ